MADAVPIIDVWTQHISGTPPGTNPEGENVFRNYGMLEVFHHGTDLAKMIDAMDRAGVRAALMAGDNEAVAQAQQRHPGRIFGQYHASPVHIMKAVPRSATPGRSIPRRPGARSTSTRWRSTSPSCASCAATSAGRGPRR